MINETIVRQVRYPPEIIPDSWFGNVPLTGEAAPPVLDLKNFRPSLITLMDIQLTANALINLRARYEGVRIEENTAAMLSAFPGAWRLPAKNTLYFNFFGVGAVVNYTTFYSLVAIKPTLAHKVLLGITMTAEEKALVASLNVADSVQKGVLPLPLEYQIQREYTILGEETHARSINIAVANTVFTVEILYPKQGEILVLTRIAAAPAGAANVVRLTIDRDDDVNYADVRTFPLSLVPGGEIACFIPAIREIRLTTQAAVAPGAHLFRYTFQRVKLTNVLRARFGLATRDELPGDVYDKVMAGIL